MNLLEILIAYKKRNDVILVYKGVLVSKIPLKKSNTNFVSCIIVVMSLTLDNFASKSLIFN